MPPLADQPEINLDTRPRVLMIGSSPLNDQSATGITLCNLFSGYPSDRIAQIYDDESSPDASLCTKYYRFSSTDIGPIRRAKRLLQSFRRNVSKHLHSTPRSELRVASSSMSSELLRAFGDIVPFRIPAPMDAWIRDFAPDLIYSPLGSTRWMNLSLKIADRLALPIIPHFMDDWPAVEYSRSRMLSIPARVLRRRLGNILSLSPCRLTISEDMSEEYRSRYGGRFESFMNCVELPRPSAKKCPEPSGPVRFGFVGGLHLNRWRSILDLAYALEELRNSGMGVALEIYAPERDLLQYGSQFAHFNVISCMETLAPRAVGEKLLTLDVLIHVESFLPEDSSRAKLSISTKIPQYLAAAKPILGYGPGDLSSLRYIEGTGSGFTVTTDGDVAALVRAARQLASDPKLRKRIGDTGRRVATSHHARDVVSRNFSSILTSVAQNRLSAPDGVNGAKN